MMDRAQRERKRKIGLRIVWVVAAVVGVVAAAVVGRYLLRRARNPVVVIETSMGAITAELRADKVPATVENFLGYVDEGFYDGLVFHRVIDGFVVQGGSFKADLTVPPMREPIANEARPEMRNRRGSLAMARKGDPHSATSGFYINLADNAKLDPRTRPPRKWGYCVFGEVTEGMDVVDTIGRVPTGPGGPFDRDVPVEPVIIKSIRRAK